MRIHWSTSWVTGCRLVKAMLLLRKITTDDIGIMKYEAINMSLQAPRQAGIPRA